MLDEGIDVPDANLGVVMSASRTRRQMIQRMGRILRRKRAGIAARFVIMFAKDTLEDPASRIERDGFLDEIERISEASGVFDGAHFDELAAFLAAPGPPVVPAPEHLESYERAAVAAGAAPDGAVDDTMVETLTGALGVEVTYAFLTFGRSDKSEPVSEAAMRGARRTSPPPRACRCISSDRPPRSPRDREAEGAAQAAVDRSDGTRDRAHRIGLAHQLHRLR